MLCFDKLISEHYNKKTILKLFVLWECIFKNIQRENLFSIIFGLKPCCFFIFLNKVTSFFFAGLMYVLAQLAGSIVGAAFMWLYV